MKIVFKILAGAAILAFAFMILSIRMGFRSSDAATLKYFRKRGVEAEIRRIPFEEGELRWVQTGVADPEKPLILFVHGAPGSANNFFRYQADSLLRSKATMVSIDRPGYGYSAYGRSEISIARQAAAVKAVIDAFGGRKAVLVGHSYGGPIIAKTGMDYPESVASLLMLAPVNDPEHEPIFWFARFGRWKATRWMLSPAWRVSADEKLSHVAELEKIKSGWETLRMPVVHLHGDKDALAPPANADFSERQIPAEYLRLVRMTGAGHLIPFLNYDRVKAELAGLLLNP